MAMLAARFQWEEAVNKDPEKKNKEEKILVAKMPTTMGCLQRVKELYFKNRVKKWI